MTKQEEIQLLLQEANSLNLETLNESLDLILKANGEIIQSIYDSKPELGLGEVYIETLLIKILLTSKSILDLSKGIEISTFNHPNKIELIDRPSLYILTRSIIECFLTLEYLFFNNLNREEQIFRYNLWTISGFQSRQNYYENLKPELVLKLENEKKEIEKTKSDLKNSKYYSKLTKTDLWKLDKFGFPRIMSWTKLLEESILKNEIFAKIYGLYSNYAHSEFISIIQINGNKLGKNDTFNIETVITTLNNVRILNCVSIILLSNKFTFAKESFEKLDKKLKYSIEFWNKFAIK